MTHTDSIVVLTGDGPEHKYVTNLICEGFDVSAIFVVHEARRGIRRFLRHGIVTFLDKLALRTFLFAIRDEEARSISLTRVLGNQSRRFAEPDKLVQMDGGDAEALAGAVARLSPRVIVVYGTGKIADIVLEQAGEIALNMHTGLSPYYRGTACAFWPIAMNDPERVGATVHRCTSQMDGGTIYFSESTRLFRDDDLHSIFARAVKTGGKGYVEVLRALFRNELVGVQPNLSVGREYRGHMRGIRAEIRARYNLARMRRFWRADLPDLTTGPAGR